MAKLIALGAMLYLGWSALGFIADHWIIATISFFALGVISPFVMSTTVPGDNRPKPVSPPSPPDTTALDQPTYIEPVSKTADELLREMKIDRIRAETGLRLYDQSQRAIAALNAATSDLELAVSDSERTAARIAGDKAMKLMATARRAHHLADRARLKDEAKRKLTDSLVARFNSY